MQENYLNIKPFLAPEVKETRAVLAHLDAVALAADSISNGDILDKVIRSQQKFQLLNNFGIMSSVTPAVLLHGYLGGKINFPR